MEKVIVSQADLVLFKSYLVFSICSILHAFLGSRVPDHHTSFGCGKLRVILRSDYAQSRTP